MHILNVGKTTVEIESNIKKLLEDKNVIASYFPKTTNQHHSDTMNIECAYPTIYKQFVKKTVMLYNKYIRFNPHLRSYHEEYAPNEEALKKFSYIEVANPILALQNASG